MYIYIYIYIYIYVYIYIYLLESSRARSARASFSYGTRHRTTEACPEASLFQAASLKNMRRGLPKASPKDPENTMPNQTKAAQPKAHVFLPRALNKNARDPQKHLRRDWKIMQKGVPKRHVRQHKFLPRLVSP